jgi:hypothetical protein
MQGTVCNYNDPESSVVDGWSTRKKLSPTSEAAGQLPAQSTTRHETTRFRPHIRISFKVQSGVHTQSPSQEAIIDERRESMHDVQVMQAVSADD